MPLKPPRKDDEQAAPPRAWNWIESPTAKRLRRTSASMRAHSASRSTPRALRRRKSTSRSHLEPPTPGLLGPSRASGGGTTGPADGGRNGGQTVRVPGTNAQHPMRAAASGADRRARGLRTPGALLLHGGVGEVDKEVVDLPRVEGVPLRRHPREPLRPRSGVGHFAAGVPLPRHSCTCDSAGRPCALHWTAPLVTAYVRPRAITAYLLVDERLKRGEARGEDVEAEVELEPLEGERSRDVPLDDVGLAVGDAGDVVGEEDAAAAAEADGLEDPGRGRRRGRGGLFGSGREGGARDMRRGCWFRSL